MRVCLYIDGASHTSVFGFISEIERPEGCLSFIYFVFFQVLCWWHHKNLTACVPARIYDVIPSDAHWSRFSGGCLDLTPWLGCSYVFPYPRFSKRAKEHPKQSRNGRDTLNLCILRVLADLWVVDLWALVWACVLFVCESKIVMGVCAFKRPCQVLPIFIYIIRFWM